MSFQLKYTMNTDSVGSALNAVKTEIARRRDNINLTCRTKSAAQVAAAQRDTLDGICKFLESIEVPNAPNSDRPALVNETAAKVERQYALGEACEWFDNVISCLDRQLSEIHDHRARMLEEAELVNKGIKSHGKPSDPIGYALGFLASYPSNYRLDLAPARAARLDATFNRGAR